MKNRNKLISNFLIVNIVLVIISIRMITVNPEVEKVESNITTPKEFHVTEYPLVTGKPFVVNPTIEPYILVKLNDFLHIEMYSDFVLYNKVVNFGMSEGILDYPKDRYLTGLFYPFQIEEETAELFDDYTAVSYTYDGVKYNGLYIGNGRMLSTTEVCKNVTCKVYDLRSIDDYVYSMKIINNPLVEDMINIEKTIVEPKPKKKVVKKTKRVTKSVSKFSKFVKMTAILESNNRDVDTKGYWGRYQISKKYTTYYTKRLGVKHSKYKKPSHQLQNRIVKLIYKDCVAHLKRKRMRVSYYNLRMVYMLGTGNFNDMCKNKLSKDIINRNMPNSAGKKSIGNFKRYWKRKVRQTV